MSFTVGETKRFRKGKLMISLTATELKYCASVAKFDGEASWQPNHNVFPGDACPILTTRTGSREQMLEVAHWGVRVPKFSKPLERYVAKAETLFKSPESLDAYPYYTRAVVLVEAAFLWGARPSGSGRLEADRRNQIYLMRPVNAGDLMPIAALRFAETITRPKKGTTFNRVSFLTITRPLVAESRVVPKEWATHVRRQPLILNQDEMGKWMGGEMPLDSFLDRMDSSKFQKLKVQLPFHVGFWVEDPEIRDGRVLQTRTDWDIEIDWKKTEIHEAKLRQEEMKMAEPTTPDKAASPSAMPLSSAKKRSLSETMEEYTSDPMLLAAFESDGFTQEPVQSKRRRISAVATDSGDVRDVIELQNSSSDSDDTHTRKKDSKYKA